MKEQPEKYYLLNDEPECTNVCYWYVPERLRPRQFPQAYTRDWHIELGKVKFSQKTKLETKYEHKYEIIKYPEVSLICNFSYSR